MAWNDVEIDWDEDKNDRNKRRRQISFEEAATVFDDPLALISPDEAHSFGEQRYHIVGESILGQILVAPTPSAEIQFASSARGFQPAENYEIMKKEIKEIDFSKGMRNKFYGRRLVIVGGKRGNRQRNATGRLFHFVNNRTKRFVEIRAANRKEARLAFLDQFALKRMPAGFEIFEVELAA